jgi:hypothetical protein
LPAPLYEQVEAGDNGITRKATASEREISGGRAIALAEPPDTVGTEAARVASRVGDELFELEPRRRSIRNELV